LSAVEGQLPKIGEGAGEFFANVGILFDLEAGLKARGLGLARANDGRSRAMERRLRRWRLALPAGYAGAVALLDPG